MGLESTHYFQIVTSNNDRAKALQHALPGGKSVHFPFSPVNEDLAKKYCNTDRLSLYDALLQAKRISEYKGKRDFNTIGGVSGAVAQLSLIGKSKEDTQQFEELVRMTSDSLQLVFDDVDVVRILHKPSGPELLTLPDQLSGRQTAIVTAVTRIVAPLKKSLSASADELAAHVSTILFMTRYTLREFTKREYADFVAGQGGGPQRTRSISGGLPFVLNPFVDTTKSFEIYVINPQTGGEYPLRRGTDWENLNRSQCVHGAFPSAIKDLIDRPGIPLARSGLIYKK